MTQDSAAGHGGPISTRAYRVPISEWQYYLVQPDQDPTVPAPSLSDGFVATAQNGVFITAATESGDMSVIAEVHHDSPLLDAAAWEDVSEVSVQISEEPLLICSFGFVPISDVPLGEAHGGTYRLRIHGRNRDLVHSRGLGSKGPDEQHLIQLWPAPQQPAATIKQTSAFSNMMRPH
jgi:hypothetical protein